MERTILQHLISNQILHTAQHGLISGQSTCTNLLESLNDWTIYVQHRQQVTVIHIDFSKAFDVVMCHVYTAVFLSETQSLVAC